MHENSLLRREWTDRRVGRVKRSDSREEPYISSESWLDDYACALVLSGWQSIHWGRKCSAYQRRIIVNLMNLLVKYIFALQ